MKIALVTDAWHPQVNGVVRTLDTVIGILRQWGHEVLVISPDQYRSVAAPSYPEIRLAMTRARSVGRRIAEFGADAVHLATEGPLCLSARRSNVRSQRLIIRNFPNISPSAPICRRAFSGLISVGFTERRRQSWRRPTASNSNW